MAEVVVALDLDDADAALSLVDQLEGLRWVKIGPVLYVRSGPFLVGELKNRRLNVFLDLKWYDIPNTVAEAARAAAGAGIDLATVHALGGGRMIEVASEAAGAMRLAAVTVLTSFDPANYWLTVDSRGGEGGDLTGEVSRLAKLAVGAGAGAVVSSTAEIGDVRTAVGPDPWIVVPGIRLQALEGDDQHRVGTPREAVVAGATHLVVGRPIYQADDPAEVFEELCEAT
jgi:orotidine-5'-phosphate decarboxylase